MRTGLETLRGSKIDQVTLLPWQEYFYPLQFSTYTVSILKLARQRI